MDFACHQIKLPYISHMLENLKKLSHGTLIYGIGHILTRSLAFLLLPLYTNVFTPEELGIVTLVLAFLAVMNLFFIYGFDSAFLRFYITEKKNDEKNYTRHLLSDSSFHLDCIFIDYLFWK